MSCPVETVYDLEANCRDSACTNSTSNRPLTNPLIFHVHNIESGLELIDQSEPKITQLVKTLGEKQWPGPLTLVVKANQHVVQPITA